MQKRNCNLHLRLTDGEMADFRNKAERAGVNVQTYFLWMLNNHPIKEMPSVEFYEVLKHLREINVSMNQIAAKANAMNLIDTVKYWANVSDLQKAIGEIMEEIYR
ncbi:MAG: plasmid mobilization relaxosome protein MobC [Lachnospiraceae bacterium]|nr:plasmid mobilization relaxosome protein MobC [Lachnospiraceae bacterium]